MREMDEDMEADGLDYAEEQRAEYLRTLRDEDGNPVYDAAPCEICGDDSTKSVDGHPFCDDCARLFFRERGSTLAGFALILAGCAGIALLWVLCIAASPRGELARAWLAGLFAVFGG